MRSMVMSLLSVSSMSVGQPTALNSMNTHHFIGEDTLEVGHINIHFSHKPNITWVRGAQEDQIQFLCSDVVCKTTDKNIIRIHDTLPCFLQADIAPHTKEIVFTMKFDPTKLSVSVDEFQDTSQGVSLVIRVYDQVSLQLLDRLNSSILRML